MQLNDFIVLFISRAAFLPVVPNRKKKMIRFYIKFNCGIKNTTIFAFLLFFVYISLCFQEKKYTSILFFYFSTNKDTFHR